MRDQFAIKWLDHGRDPVSVPNPAHPNGVDLDFTEGKTPTCKVDLDYPAKRCGLYVVECKTCGLKIAITTAGRPDDPRSVKMPCKRGSLQ